MLSLEQLQCNYMMLLDWKYSIERCIAVIKSRNYILQRFDLNIDDIVQHPLQQLLHMHQRVEAKLETLLEIKWTRVLRKLNCLVFLLKQTINLEI